MKGWLTKYSLLLFLVIAISSCEKPVDSQVRITVKDNAGNELSGIVVKLYGESTDSVYVNKLSLYDLEETTNDGGLVVFDFNDFYDQGDNGFAILTVEVARDTNIYKSLVKVIEGETISKEITLP